MIITLKIPDEVIEKIRAFDPPVKSQEGLESFLVKLIETFCLDPRQRHLVVTSEDRKRLEKLFDLPIATTKVLIERAEKHASLTLGNVRVEASTEQLARLHDMAKKNQKDPQKFAEEIFKQIAPHFIGAY